MAWRHKETGTEVFRAQYVENKQYWRLDVNRHAKLTPYRRPKLTPLSCVEIRA
jgi:hypothetical protein